ncbi:STAS domain-containing protein [Geodermatophilus sp. YIM 151500]|uniref:STAS domain-containing protein n=1 Tax=Geodermatophilus sp. YIM 151500 TaxID=2984531 RepID=UPI0021E47849|nr:STAS domain-containing protein [Geodermatophilus sp. YIM 151500]MCV2489800.1 STAS domain-containing protein [Geodermatophilus sp. YIM 151500]
MLHTPNHRSVPAPGQLLSVTTLPDPRPGRVVVEVVGEVDSYTAPVLEICLQSQATRAGLHELVVFLGQVRFLGAAGVEVLARADERCRMRGARLVIRTGGRRCVLRPLELTGLTAVVAVDPADGERTQLRRSRAGGPPRTSPRRPPARRPRRVCG